MEAAAAIGVASGTIAFLRFTIDICKTFGQITTSHEGITKHNAGVEATVNKYKNMSEALKAKGASATSLELGPDISKAVDESIAVYAELLILIEQLRQARDTRVIGPVKAVYRSLRSRERIQSLQHKAERCQSAISQGLLEATWETSALNHESSTNALQRLDEEDTKILAAVKAGNVDLLKQLIESRRHFDTTVSDLQGSIRTGNDHVTQKIDSLVQKVLDMAKPDLTKAFVDSLFFPDYERREKDLTGPSPRTFEWIFDRCPTNWPSFPQWLEDENSSQQYWLSGKAGSGKSTLMAHIIREDMALHRTVRHLKNWHGSKPLHVLKFFLFRPRRERQAGLESLLRSLLYQLVTSIPIMQEILMARFLRSDSCARIPTWPVETLKLMLLSALDAADDCCFFLFIDGADEFEDSQHARGWCIDATDLVDFLVEIQQPNHVKLCISSRPELRITNVHPSFLETKLAGLNYDDVRRFAHEQIQAMVAISDPEYRSCLATEITSRAEGIFLWAAFAVTQLKKACRDGYGDDHPELWKRLDDTGKDLNDAISQMLRGIQGSHRPALAFYLQALKSWRDADMRENLTVGLIAASRFGEQTQTRSHFLAACRREERDIHNFSQGMIQVGGSRLTRRNGEFALVRSHSDRSSESDLEREALDFKPGEGAWVTVAHSGHYLELTMFCKAGVSLIHRSTYDFFFAPDHWNTDHVEQCKSLLEHSEGSSVNVKVQGGLRKLLWIQPWPISRGIGYKRYTLNYEILKCASDLVSYTIGTANPSLAQGELTNFMNDLLSSMRLELLLGLVKAPIIESRKHVPGNIFSSRLHNGSLRELDDDGLLTFESTGLPDDLAMMAKFEGHFLTNCFMWAQLHDYIKNHLSDFTGRPIAPLVQAVLLEEVAKYAIERTFWWFFSGQVLLLNSVQRWVHTLTHTSRSLESYKSIWQWIARLVPGYVGSPRYDGPSGTRPRYVKLGDQYLSFQWTPLASDDMTNWHEERMIMVLFMYVIRSISLPEGDENSGNVGRLARIMEPWNVWIELLSASGSRKDLTALFIRFGSATLASFMTGEEYASDSRAGRYRLACIDDSAIADGSSKLLFSVDIDSSIALYDGPVFVPRENEWQGLRAEALEQRKVDVLIDAVRQSTKLNEDEKDRMIDCIEAFDILDPQT
jgi:hypothetical protein